MTCCSNFLNSSTIIHMEHNFVIDFFVVLSCEIKIIVKQFQLWMSRSLFSASAILHCFLSLWKGKSLLLVPEPVSWPYIMPDQMKLLAFKILSWWNDRLSLTLLNSSTIVKWIAFLLKCQSDKRESYCNVKISKAISVSRIPFVYLFMYFGRTLDAGIYAP